MPIRRGEVYFVDLNPTRGHEQAGTRPVVVMSNDVINGRRLVVAAVPGTRGIKLKPNLPWNVRIPAGEGGLPEETVFMAFQVRALDHSRFTGPPVGVSSQTWLARIEAALSLTFALAPGSGP